MESARRYLTAHRRRTCSGGPHPSGSSTACTHGGSPGLPSACREDFGADLLSLPLRNDQPVLLRWRHRPGAGQRPSDRRRQRLPGISRGDLRHHNRLLCTGIGHPSILTAPGAARRCRPVMSLDRVVPVKARSGPTAGTGPGHPSPLDARPGAHFRRQLPGADQSNNAAGSRSVSSNQIPSVSRAGICEGSTHLAATW